MRYIATAPLPEASESLPPTGGASLRANNRLIRPRHLRGAGSDAMCYAVYISTDSPEDLRVRSSDLVRFEPLDGSRKDPCIALLEHANRWYVGSKSDCSCTFRHLTSIELGFREPEDWYKEGQDELDATRELYTDLAVLLSAGHEVDLIDRWEGARPDDIKTLQVSLEEVSQGAFRLFENHKFRLSVSPIRTE
jgi:hypothetical protein